MCKLFEDWSEQIKEYCELNGLDFTKASRMEKSWNKNSILLGYHDKTKGTQGLLDDTPMPVVLAVFQRPDGSLRFEQTEHTEKYLKKIEPIRSAACRVSPKPRPRKVTPKELMPKSDATSTKT